ncbi:carboxy terminal-processing peptidase [Luteibacter anthropi]|uniref:Carboxy terminal-processing peptidase n=1 Tax=Luteibacter anthropi TaxID=564369 RepID=A0A7X5UEJ2_9GAMM|nr:carboxy terminal-processing peptidase [Luteibacter anthropi]NII08768.1 carboxy terminal-processing peptidase [Luteibacter anthropi]URX63216.1 carboxy terminal-processing peptidase [Luteibacter anthropi]
MTLRPVSLALLLVLATAGAQAQNAPQQPQPGATPPVKSSAPQPKDASEAATSPEPQRKESSLPLKPTAAEAQAAQLSARFLTRFHYQAQPLDDAMSAKIYKAYFDSLDGEKVFFTQEDMAKFEPLKTQFDDAIWNQDLSGPFSVFNLYITRAVDRMNFARGLLKKGFDLSGNESFNFDRKKAAVPKDQAELDDIWRKRTMNDWLRLKLAGKSDDDIRKTLDKRYANYITRVRQLDDEDATQAFMTAYANSTDPHTDYLGPRAADAFDIAMRLSLEGIGAVLQARDDYTTIRELVPGGPAIKSGKMKPGDRIVAIGQGETGTMVDVVGWRQDDVIKLIRGKKDTTVRLEILPADAGVDGKHEIVTLVRKKVTMEEQAAKSKVIDVKDGDVTRKIGVIELPTFYQDFGARRAGDANFKSATRDVKKLLTALKAQKVDGIIMDLRNNGGGSLNEATELTGLFIDTGPVVQVRDARGQVEAQGDDDPGMSWDGPMAVMVNRGSASASEIFAAAIQDYGRGIIIGEPTFGKGTVQNLVDLDKFGKATTGEDAKYGELKMTIAEFIRINGDSTQLHGVTPDVRFPENGDAKEFGESTYDNALPWRHIDPADYKPVANLKPIFGPLNQKHEARVASSPAWKLMLDELAQYKKMRDKTDISLNFATRMAERKQFDATQADFRNRRKAIFGDSALDTTDDNSGDDGLNANERSIKSDLKQEADAKKAKDTPMDEAAHIVSDEVALIKGDAKLASQVLPYGGRKVDAPQTAQADKPAPNSP